MPGRARERQFRWRRNGELGMEGTFGFLKIASSLEILVGELHISTPSLGRGYLFSKSD